MKAVLLVVVASWLLMLGEIEGHSSNVFLRDLEHMEDDHDHVQEAQEAKKATTVAPPLLTTPPPVAKAIVDAVKPQEVVEEDIDEEEDYDEEEEEDETVADGQKKGTGEAVAAAKVGVDVPVAGDVKEDDNKDKVESGGAKVNADKDSEKKDAKSEIGSGDQEEIKTNVSETDGSKKVDDEYKFIFIWGDDRDNFDGEEVADEDMILENEVIDAVLHMNDAEDYQGDEGYSEEVLEGDGSGKDDSIDELEEDGLAKDKDDNESIVKVEEKVTNAKKVENKDVNAETVKTASEAIGSVADVEKKKPAVVTLTAGKGGVSDGVDANTTPEAEYEGAGIGPLSVDDEDEVEEDEEENEGDEGVKKDVGDEKVGVVETDKTVEEIDGVCTKVGDDKSCENIAKDESWLEWLFDW